MINGNVILNKLGKDKFCDWIKKNGHKFSHGINLQYADLQYADLQYAKLQYANLKYANLKHANLKHANLKHANLYRANLQGANIDFSCLPLWCGSTNMTIDERIAKQLLAHAFNVGLKYFPGSLTEGQKAWLNTFHRIKSKEFPKF